MNTQIHRFALLTLLAAAGCSTVGPYSRIVPSAGGTDYRGGTAARVFETGSETIVLARKAMEDTGVHSIQELHQRDGIALEGRTADDRRAFLTTRIQGSRAMVTAKIGIVGDEALSRAILDRMAALAPDRGGEGAAPVPIIEEGAKPRARLSRDAVSDESMLRNQADAGYRDSPIP
ncbi:MAG: DUF3568 domain-containing protein [Isosphaeraceae bacterium]|nr:DUF3568 domain-containing protein [Isosphaeraceae bacterium]